jgi:hypothetical protein
MLLSTVGLLGHARVFAARAELDRRQVAGLVQAVPPGYLPKDTCLVFLTNDGILLGKHTPATETVDGVLEVSYAALGAVQMGYGRSDLKVICVPRCPYPALAGFRYGTGGGTSPRGLILKGKVLDPERALIYVWCDGAGSVIEDLKLRGEFGPPRSIHFPIAERLRRDGLPTTELTALDGSSLPEGMLFGSLGTVEMAPPSCAGLSQFWVGSDRRLVLFQHASRPPAVTEARWRGLRLPPGGTLRFGITLNPALWGKPGCGDGVEFVVAVERGGRRTTVFRRYLDPKNDPADRRWFDCAVPLGRFAGGPVDLVLTTLPGPKGDNAWDHAGWSYLRIDPAP